MEIQIEETFETVEDIEDKTDMTIPKGTTVYVLKQLTNPMTKREELIIAIDNGTRLAPDASIDLQLMPKTLIELEEE